MQPNAKPQLSYMGYNASSPAFGEYIRGGVNGVNGNTNGANATGFPMHYSGYPSTAYPFFQSAAAVAAVAAAAAGYSQHLSSGMKPALPLNLSNLNACSQSRDTYMAAAQLQEASAGAYGSGTYQQYTYQHPYYQYQQYAQARHAFQPMGNKPSANPNPTTPLVVSAAPAYTPAATGETVESSAAFIRDRQYPQQHQQQQQPVQSMSPSGGQQRKTSSSSARRTKTKARGSSNLHSADYEGTGDEEEKKKEFKKLVKARTDQLLSDGPVYPTPGTDAALDHAIHVPGEGTGSSSSSGPTTNCTSDGTLAMTNAKIIKAVLDAKTCLLLNSPSVCEFLQSRQRMLEEQKRATELFTSTIPLPHGLSVLPSKSSDL